MDLDHILEISNRCIRNEPPVCQSSCPVHVDVISLVREIENKDYSKAYKLLAAKIPFEQLICRICDHPCENVCVRKDAGGSIRISELEKAVLAAAGSISKKSFSLPKTKGKIAVIGGGLSGCIVAAELDKKGYQIEIYEKTDRLGGRLWSYLNGGLEEELIQKELQVLHQPDIKLHFNTEIRHEWIGEHTEQYDAIYLGTGTFDERLQIDPLTLQAADAPIFAGGSLYAGETSLIEMVSAAKRAIISLERYVKKTSLTASREKEGAFETKLHYDMGHAASQSPVICSGSTYSDTEMSEEAARCFQCQCDACIKACVHMQKYNITPNDYIRGINHNERIIKGTHFANEMINSCTECGLCKECCPEHIDMGTIIHETRESMVEREKMPPSVHDFALRDMAFSTGSRFSLLKEQPGHETSFLFYPGCQLSASHGDKIIKLYQHLTETVGKNKQGGVGIYLDCCGAPADWSGNRRLAEMHAEEIQKNWEELGRPVFIIACPSCMSVFDKYLPMIGTISLWEILDQYGLPESAGNMENRIFHIHDACASRYQGSVQSSMRSIAGKLGCQILEMEYSKERTKCCGYGGLASYANREQADLFAKDRKAESSADLMVYCAMCQDSFSKGSEPVYHILDLIYGEAPVNGTGKMPTLSERQHNRMLLKKHLLKEIWGEEMMIEEADDRFTIEIPDHVITVMEQRYILVEDIRRVIEHSIDTQERFYNQQEDSYLARLRIENVTYWVSYREKDGKIMVENTYSHRMSVLEE